MNQKRSGAVRLIEVVGRDLRRSNYKSSFFTPAFFVQTGQFQQIFLQVRGEISAGGVKKIWQVDQSARWFRKSSISNAKIAETAQRKGFERAKKGRGGLSLTPLLRSKKQKLQRKKKERKQHKTAKTFPDFVTDKSCKCIALPSKF